MHKIISKKAFTLVEILIVAGIISLIAAIAIPNLIAAKRSANETAAKSNIRSLSAAAETASVSLGGYPVTVAQFQNFIGSVTNFCTNLSGTPTTRHGYNYSCTMDLTGYTLVASPETLGTTGNITYTATTGGVITPL